MPITPINGSATFPATANEFVTAVETIASQNIRSVVSTNRIEDAFYEYQVEDGKVIQEAIIAMAEAQSFTPVAEGAQPNLAPVDPKLYIRYFNNFVEKQFKTTIRNDEIRAVMARGNSAEEAASRILDTLTQGEGDYDYTQERAIIEDASVGVDASTALLGGKKPASSKGIMYAVRRMFNAIKATNLVGLADGVSTKQGVPVEDIRIAISEDVLALVDMTELANLFNLSKEEILGKVVSLPYDSNYTGSRVLVYDRKALGRATRTFEYGMADLRGTNRYVLHALTTSRAYFYNGLFKCLSLDVSAAKAAEEGNLLEE